MKVVITGASGKLGVYLLEAALERNWDVRAWSGSATGEIAGVPLRPVDLGDLTQLQEAFDQEQPDAVIHSAALSVVGDCYRDPSLAQRINVDATHKLAQLCQAKGARLLSVSTDMVFDGEDAPYDEDFIPTPKTVYGQSKVAGERAALGAGNALVARVALMYGKPKSSRVGFLEQFAQRLQNGDSIDVFHDEWRTPLFLGDAAAALCQLLLGQGRGIVHLPGPQRFSRLEMAQAAARHWQLDSRLLRSVSRSSVNFDEPRQRDLSLRSRRHEELLPDFQWRCLEEVLSGPLGR